MRVQLLAGMVAALAAVVPPAYSQDQFITVASTTSTEQSGLFAYLLPLFHKATGIAVRVVAVGTGQALKIGARGDADVVFVHDKPAEEAFAADGQGVGRRDVMYNDFVIVGPATDPAKIRAQSDAVAALSLIHKAAAPFVSRGDDSGTYRVEQRLWALAGINPQSSRGSWYRETGSGMGSALNTAAAMDAYLLSDRATWVTFKNRRNLAILVQGDPRLFNQYGIMLVNPAKHLHIKAQLAQTFIDWVVSGEGQSAIAHYRVAGEQLFFPNAPRS